MSDLRGKNPSEEMKTGSAGKIVSALIVAVALGGAGTYAYQTGMFHPHPAQRVAANELPSPVLPGAPTPQAQ